MTSVVVNGYVEPGELPRLARWWFETAAEELLAPAVGGLRDGDVVLPRSGQPLGKPGDMWASLTRYGNLAGRVTSRRAWSRRGWTAFLDGLKKFPAAAQMDLLELDAGGGRRHADLATINVDVVSEDGGWFRMGCEFGGFEHGPRNRIAGVTEADARNFLWKAVHRLPVTFGGVGDDGQVNGPTMLESALHRDAVSGVLHSREVLRGYPWVTVCAPEIVARLGGLDALRAGGAFYEVAALPGGAAWLQATESLAEYEGETLHRVFRTLAAVLPPGKPEPYVGREIGRIVYEDASLCKG